MFKKHLFWYAFRGVCGRFVLFCFKQIRVLIKYFYCLIFSSFLFLFFFFPPLLGKKLQYLFEPYFRIESYTFALWDTRG